MSRLAFIGIAIASIVIIMAIFAQFIATHDPTAQNLGLRFLSPSGEHWFGTDGLGRDVFSRVVYGSRVSLQVGVTVVLISGVIGIIIGSVAGFYGGWLDKFLSGYLFNVFLAFPGLLLAIALAAFVDEHKALAFIVGDEAATSILSLFSPGIFKMLLALCAIGWVGYARVMRGQVLKVREYDFVMAARALGAGNLRILFTHILPNAIQPLIVQASLGMAGAVLSEASLSFLGLGIPPPAPSWGTMIEEARNYFSTYPHTLFFPGAAIALTVLAFNFIGDGLREYLDPKQRAR
jgi:peptide/nickel transport system permease protein